MELHVLIHWTVIYAIVALINTAVFTVNKVWRKPVIMVFVIDQLFSVKISQICFDCVDWTFRQRLSNNALIRKINIWCLPGKCYVYLVKSSSSLIANMHEIHQRLFNYLPRMFYKMIYKVIASDTYSTLCSNINNNRRNKECFKNY